MVRVSIIVPCYNVGKFLPECLDCLVQQTLQDIEIICIDDKSNDNTRAIMHEFAEQDSRIHVIEFNKNRGVAAARNAGIDMARGEYIGFVDPDDTVDKDFFAVLYKLATDNHADIAKGIAKMVDTNGTTSVLNSNDEIRTAKYNFCTCFWTAIYRREFLNQNNIRFPDGLIVSEDLVFLIKSVHFANMVATTDDVSYWYIRHEDSADSAAFSTCKIDSGVSAIQQLIQWGNTQPDMDTDEYNKLLNILIPNKGENVEIRTPIAGVNLSKVKIGNNVVVMNDSLMMASGGITIEDNTMLAANVQLISNNHDLDERAIITCLPIHIKKNCWIGAGATILRGVTIGENSVVGAGSVVTKDVPDNVIVAGNPAKIIKNI